MSRQVLARAVLLIVCALPLHPGTGFLWAQTPGAAALPKYSELIARSSELTAEQKSQALTFFKLGFDLWQSGDFSAAQIAFKQGLDIDPVNPQANYYYGDSLLKTKDRKGAAEFFARSAALGPATLEGIKSQAALKDLSKPVALADMSPEEVKDLYVGAWLMGGSGLGEGDEDMKFVIAKDDKGDLIVSGSPTCFFCGGTKFANMTFDGRNIHFDWVGNNLFLTYHLVGPKRIEGDYRGRASGVAFAVKK